MDKILVLMRSWIDVSFSTLVFDHKNEALLVATALAALLFLALIMRFEVRKHPGKQTILFPAVIEAQKRKQSVWRHVRHIPVMLFALGSVSYLVAVSDPRNVNEQEEEKHQGRKIVIVVDASGSMGGATVFDSTAKVIRGGKRFFSAMSAAEYFVKLRIKGAYRDLLSLVIFADESFIVTPFTQDYENALLGIRLAGDSVAYERFNYSNTRIISGMDQAVSLFKIFGFLRSSGNAILLLSDGEDTQTIFEGISLDSIVATAKANSIPIYFVRTGRKALLYNDATWSDAVITTGGKFYPASDEESLLAAVEDIDKDVIGEVSYKRYNVHTPRFQIFAAIAAICWISALLLVLGYKLFRIFP